MDDTGNVPNAVISSRRSILAAAVGGLGAWVAASLGRPQEVRAGSDGDVVLGESNDAVAFTTLIKMGAGNPAFAGVNHGSGVGVHGHSSADPGDTIVSFAKTGVSGYAAQDSLATGVLGRTTVGRGVRGEATSGIAVQGAASSQSGYAFRGSGRVRFDKVSGVATIAANATSVTITPGVDLNADSFVLLTPKANIGTRSLYFSTDATNNKFTIRISSSRTSSTPVAWLLLR